MEKEEKKELNAEESLVKIMSGGKPSNEYEEALKKDIDRVIREGKYVIDIPFME
jgi:hypothetical protein